MCQNPVGRVFGFLGCGPASNTEFCLLVLVGRTSHRPSANGSLPYRSLYNYIIHTNSLGNLPNARSEG